MTTWTLKREIPVAETYDLVVAGGGPAGSAAAICAARRGAKVLLIEATGCLGGMGTSGLVCAFDPMANGETMLVGGFMRELVETLHARGFMAPGLDPVAWRKHYHCWSQFRAEGLKLVLDEKAAEAGVEVRFFTRLIDVDADRAEKRVRGVVVHDIEGCRYVPARTFIDATGDAVLADLCGAPCRAAGRDTERIMPPTLCSLHAGIDWPQTRKTKQQEALMQALAAGHFSQYDRHLPGLTCAGETIGYLNGGHVFGTNALDNRSLSAAMVRGRQLAQEYLAFYRQYLPGCENMELVTTGSLLGVRESRRIVGEYELNYADYQARRQFPDQIGVFNKFVDIHVQDCSDAEWERFQEEMSHSGRLRPGECFGLPYGILVPRGWANLWVAGRCNSSDVKVHGSIRVMPAAAMMGQAAGTAAVQSLRTNARAGELDTAELVETLRGDGAYLPQKSLNRTLTRA